MIPKLLALSLAVGSAMASEAADPFAEGVQHAISGDPAAAARSFEVACAAGHFRACANLATLLQQGAGLPQDLPRAAQLHQRACDADLAISCDALGSLSANGVGLPKDDEAAIQYYRRACTLGHGPGCTHLGVMLDGGFGVSRSWEQARDYYGQGCDLGDAEACWSLGRKLLGLRRADTSVEGVRRVEQACALEVPEACAAAAALYAGGEWVQADRARARELAGRACTLGHRPSCG